MNCQEIAEVLPLYLSGELDAPQTARFAEHLRTCRACTSYVATNQRLDEALRAGVLSEPVDSNGIEREVRRHIATSYLILHSLRWTAAIAALTLLGVLGYRALRPPSVCAAAAGDYHSEVILGHPRKWQTDTQAIENLAQQLGITGSVIARLAPANYSLKEGKLCRLDGRKFLHLVYTKDSQKCSLYICPRGDLNIPGTARTLHQITVGSEHVAYFVTSDWTVMLVTDQPQEIALSLANSTARAL